MATTFITNDQDGLIALVDGDEIVIVQGVNVTSGADQFSFALVNGQRFGTYEITVAGNVYVDDDFALQSFIANPETPGEVQFYLNVGQGGSIYVGGDLLVLGVSDPDITNAEAVINNAGFISVAEAAISMNGFNSIEFINSGVLTQVGNSFSPSQALFDDLGDGEAKIVNHGLIQAAEGSEIVDVSMELGSSVEIINTGIMTSAVPTAFDFDGSIASVSLDNSGMIIGGLESVSAVSFSNSGSFKGGFSGSASTDVIDNSGLIEGDLFMFFGSDVIANSGEIKGDIDASSNDDRLDNSGDIIGEVDMGSGFDTLTNAGDILGDVIMNSGEDTVVNSGTINGMVDLGSNEDNYKTAGNGFVSGTISGGAGDDTIRGGAFDDTIDGGSEDDLLRGKNGEDDLIGGSGNDSLFGGHGNDSLTGDNGDDELRGGAGDDTLIGGNNRDLLVGGTGDDDMEGGVGNDTLRGGAGDDTIAGQNGSDEMSGGAGSDIFLFTSAGQSEVGNRDDILDFQKGQDKIDIDGLSNDTFVFLGNGAFTAMGDAEVRVTSNGAGNSVVRIDVDGDGTADSEIDVLGVTGLEAGDFIL